MKKYPAYKDSGVEWLGSIPKHWDAIALKRLSPVNRGASPRPIADPKYFDEHGEYSWVRIADVSASERYLEETTEKLSELGSSLSVKQYPGDFFVSIAGTVGKPIITKIKCCIHDGFVYFPELKINREFLFYIFITGEPYQGLGKWGTQLNLNTDTIGSISIGLPPKEEIDRIVAYLDQKTALIDTLLAQSEKIIALLQEQRTAIINQAVTKGLTHLPSTQGGTLGVPLKDSGVEWIGEVPEHWIWIKLSRLCEVKDGTHDTPEYVEKGENTVPLITSNYFNNGEIEFELAKHISLRNCFKTPS